MAQNQMPRALVPAVSMLRMSAAGRVAIALAIVAVLWAAVFWAMR